MEKVRVLQGCSIQEGGYWFAQGSVLMVANPDSFTRIVKDKDGRDTVEPCVELVEHEPVNVPVGLLPEPASPEFTHTPAQPVEE